MITRDKIAGAIFGAAIGDAMGRPIEFMSYHKIIKIYGGDGYAPLPSNKYVTDDTHMSIYTGAAVLKAISPGTPKAFAHEIRREFVRWVMDPNSGPGRAPGGSCMTATRNLRRPGVWQSATTLSKGCGANMRVTPVAFVDHDDVAGLAQLQAAMTHGHPISLVAAELTAWAIRLAAEGMSPIDILDWLIRYCRVQLDNPTYHHAWLGDLSSRRWSKSRMSLYDGWSQNLEILYRVWGRISFGDDGGDACNEIGQAWLAHEALGVAMYCAVAHADDPIAAVSRGARTNGDSDSIASIAGAIVGAYHGVNAWPAEWVKQIEFSTALNLLADGLAQSENTNADMIDHLLDSATPIAVPVTGRHRKGGAADYQKWWEDALSGNIKSITNTGSTDSEYDSIVDDLLNSWDDSVIPQVIRRPDGRIDHSHCIHGDSKAAKRRCTNRNKNTDRLAD